MSCFVTFLLYLVNLEYYNAIAMLEINLNVRNQMWPTVVTYDAATVTILNVYIILICVFYLHNVFFFQFCPTFLTTMFSILWCCKCNKMFARFRLPCVRFFKVAVRVYNSNAIFRGLRDFWKVFYEHIFQGNLQFHHLSWGRYISASWHYYIQVDKVHT